MPRPRRAARRAWPLTSIARAWQEHGDDVEVRPEDQRAINSFGRLNNRKHDVEDEIKEKQAFHDLLDDASNEMILADEDEPVRHVASRLHPARHCTPASFLACLGAGTGLASATLSATRTRRRSCWINRRRTR